MALKRVLIIYRSYFPSVSHLGPATAIRNLVDNMGDEYAFHLLTLNYDFSNGERLFPDEYRLETTPKVVLEYVPRGIKGIRVLARRLRNGFDIIDIHCAFDPLLAIPALILCRLGIARTDRIFHTPHGIFMDVVLSVRRWRKRIFCLFADAVNLYKGVIQLAASPAEARGISGTHLRKQKIATVSQFVTVTSKLAQYCTRQKSSGSLRIAIVGRVTAQKNVRFAIDVVRRLGLDATLDIFGTVAERTYYQECLTMIAEQPGKGKITFYGELAGDDLLKTLQTYDVLLHPSLGENFGHAIVEALSLGIPVLLSEHCPWSDVEQWNAGWSVPLSHPGDFVMRLAQLHAMSDEWQTLHHGALAYARDNFDNAATTARYRRVYEEGLAE